MGNLSLEITPNAINIYRDQAQNQTSNPTNNVRGQTPTDQVIISVPKVQAAPQRENIITYYNEISTNSDKYRKQIDLIPFIETTLDRVEVSGDPSEFQSIVSSFLSTLNGLGILRRDWIDHPNSTNKLFLDNYDVYTLKFTLERIRTSIAQRLISKSQNAPSGVSRLATNPSILGGVQELLDSSGGTLFNKQAFLDKLPKEGEQGHNDQISRFTNFIKNKEFPEGTTIQTLKEIIIQEFALKEQNSSAIIDALGLGVSSLSLSKFSEIVDKILSDQIALIDNFNKVSIDFKKNIFDRLIELTK